MFFNIQSKLLFSLLFRDINKSCYPSVAFLKSVSIYFDTWMIFNIYFKNLTLNALIIDIADDIFCNKLLHFGYKKRD